MFNKGDIVYYTTGDYIERHMVGIVQEILPTQYVTRWSHSDFSGHFRMTHTEKMLVKVEDADAI